MLGKMWDIAAKDLRQVSKDRGALIMMFAVPLLLMGILGAAFSSSSDQATVTTTLPVLNQDHGAGAQTLDSALRHTPALKVQMVSDRAAAEKAVRNGDKVGLLIIPVGFSAAMQNPHDTARLTYYSVTNNNGTEAQVARDTVQAVVQRFSFQRLTAEAVIRAQHRGHGAANITTAEALAAQATQQLDQNPPVALKPVNATGRKYNAQDNTVPGYALMFALFAVTAASRTILEEKESGTIKRLLIAPVPPFILLGGKLLAQFLQTLFQISVLFAAGVALFKINLGASIPALVLLIIGTSFAATGIGMILISLVKTERQVRPVSTLIVLAFSALGGSWWPISIEPQWMQSVGKVTLNAWAMEGFNGLMIFDKGFTQVLPDIIALFVYGILCFAIARRLFRLQEAV